MTMKHHETGSRCGVLALLLAGALALGGSLPALAEEDRAFELNRARLIADSQGDTAPGGFFLAQAEDPAEPVGDRKKAEVVDEDEASCPFSLSLTYALYTDYIFRLVNFSEPAIGEARERLNHQLTVSLSYNLGDWGTIGYDTWFEWYAGQELIDPAKGAHNLQEIDYVIWWSKEIEEIMSTFTLGITFYEFPNLSYTLNLDNNEGNNNDAHSQEWWFRVEHNDAWLWKWLFPENEEGVLNPSFFFAQDFGAIPGVWMEFGLSHGFAIPGVDNFTITPGWTVMMDCDYWTDGFGFAGDQWSLIFEYDLTPVLKLPTWAGSIVVTGDLYYTNPWASVAREVADDTLWGGMTVSWAWGG